MPTPVKPHVVALLVGLAIGGTALAQLAPPLHAQERARDAAGQKQWAAVAPGRVEAASREIKIGAPTVGRIAQVLVKPNDKVFAGEVLIRLDDDEALARLAVAEAAVAARKRARNEQSAPRGSGERRKAEDQLADAERAFADARTAFDKAADRRTGGGSEQSFNAARAAFEGAQDRLRQQRAELTRIKADPDTPLPNRTEGELIAARAELDWPK